MELKNQVSSLELSKRLKELGVPQDGFFDWSRHWHDKPYVLNQGGTMEANDKERRFSAFTVAELGEMLPADLPELNKHGSWLSVDKNEDGFWIAIYADEGISYLEIEGKTMVDAMAKMLIYLLENKLTSIH